ncbi:type I secretion system permease/ATPase [Frigidibacter sp. MR17.24]|uniref:type I secretion system permease/ATPase n=1 Tax=Frigidibacter sp. MR17.24 TaxID=3127345 RepID=UPI003012AC4A
MIRQPFPEAGADAGILAGARAPLIGIALFSAALNLLMLTGPLFMLQVYDRVLGGRSTSTLAALSLIVLYLFALMAILDHVRGRMLATIGARYQARLDRRALQAQLARRPQPDQPQDDPLRDVAQVQMLFASPVLGALFDLPFIPLFLAVLFAFHAWMGLFALAAAALILALAATGQAVTRGAQARAQAAATRAERHARAMAAEIETVEGLGMREALTIRWETARGEALAAGMGAAGRGGAVAAATRAVRLALQSAILALGAWLVLRGALTGGAMVAGSILLGRMLAPVEQVLGQGMVLQRGLASARALSRRLGAPPPPPPLALPAPGAQLVVRDLAFRLPGAAEPTLSGISFSAGPGDVIAVIGPSASGKSTLARLITGLLPPARGEIRLGGATLGQYDRDRLGRLLGYLPQQVALFEGTVAQNIARFQPGARDEDVVAAARAASAHELILSLPQGYDTRLSDGGGALSGGQRQRIGLARAFYGDPVLLVLDEPNSSLDEPGLLALNRAIASARAAGRIVFVMSHRPSALAESAKVMIIEGGTMRAFGPRDEILGRFLRNAAAVMPAAAKG